MPRMVRSYHSSMLSLALCVRKTRGYVRAATAAPTLQMMAGYAHTLDYSPGCGHANVMKSVPPLLVSDMHTMKPAEPSRTCLANLLPAAVPGPSGDAGQCRLLGEVPTAAEVSTLSSDNTCRMTNPNYWITNSTKLFQAQTQYMFTNIDFDAPKNKINTFNPSGYSYPNNKYLSDPNLDYTVWTNGDIVQVVQDGLYSTTENGVGHGCSKEHPYKHYYPPHGQYYCTTNPDGTGGLCNCSCPECGINSGYNSCESEEGHTPCILGCLPRVTYSPSVSSSSVTLPSIIPQSERCNIPTDEKVQCPYVNTVDGKWDEGGCKSASDPECCFGGEGYECYKKKDPISSSDHIEQGCQYPADTGWPTGLSGKPCYFTTSQAKCVYAGGTGAGKSPKGTVKQTHNVYTCQIQCDPGTYPTGDCTHGKCQCTACPAGYTCAGGTSAPEACTPGKYCPGGQDTPQSCAEGHYCPTPAQQILCRAGYKCTGDGEASPCAQGEFSPTGQSACTSCAINEVSEFTSGSTKCINTNPLPTPSPNAVYPVTEEYCSLLCAQTPNCVVGVVTARNTCQLWGGDCTLTEQSDLIEPTSACLVLRQPLDAMTTIQISSETPGTAAPLTTTASLSAACRAAGAHVDPVHQRPVVVQEAHAGDAGVERVQGGARGGALDIHRRSGDGVCGGQQR